ncbi:MAG TPA: alanine--tRNA ligase [Tepidisphaeraceae bacterium]
MTSAQIRQQFIDFFVAKHGHTFVPSSPVVPQDDPTLLFTNAGMNQFKPIFLGQEKRDYTRAVNTQKCIRAGGKHNDLDDVGRSRRHHTFFEMLGNWSFGDYFKQGAIEMAWELLTKVWKLDPARLHVSCFEGDEKNGVPRDTEAADIWKRVAGLSDDHIHYFGKDNFWEMGDTGPCGPCTEIYIDRTPDKTGGKDVNGEDPRVMEIWNLVFIQYNRNADRSLTPLPSRHVDTGMGFERICQVLQDVSDNYAIDLWVPFFDSLTKLSGIKYAGLYPPTNVADPAAEAANPQLRHDIAFRVIADHVRCLTFAMTDGATPSNEGRGYVLRRILRRAVRFGRQQLDLRDPFLHKLVQVVVEGMGNAFPELKKNPQRVAETIKDEELSFGRTLDRGIFWFDHAAVSAIRAALAELHPAADVSMSMHFAGASEPFFAQIVISDDPVPIDIPRNYGEFVASRFSKPPVIAAQDAFKLHDTYGFPIDLTRIMAEERGMTVDIKGYENLMEEAQERSRSARDVGGDFPVTYLPPAALVELEIYFTREKTDDSAKFKLEPITATVMAIWQGVAFPTHVSAGEFDTLAIILDKTNFYSEMGGQIGDSGTLGAPGTSFIVETTRSISGYVLHVGRLMSGAIKVGTTVTATVETFSRAGTQRNHTTTHIANWALREVLGDDVQQKGSLVDPEKLRFDFSHGKAMSDEELARMETLVNQGIEKTLPVYAEVAPQEQALKIHGLRAVFGEKYPPMVRIVSIGAPVSELLKDPANPKWREYSIEFCGGTHLRSSAEAGGFVITGEESVSKGIRRLIALTGDAARQAQKQAAQLDAALAAAEALAEPALPAAIAGLQKHLGQAAIPLRAKRRAQAAIAKLQAKQKAWEKTNKSPPAGAAAADAVSAAANLLAKSVDLAGGKLIVGEIPSASDDQLRSAMDSLKKKAPSHGIMLASGGDGKVTFVAAVSDDLIARGLKAGDWVRETAKVAGGGGGGRPQMAQAGGKDPSKISEALQTAQAYARRALGE